jgi:hypothetical protein
MTVALSGMPGEVRHAVEASFDCALFDLRSGRS